METHMHNRGDAEARARAIVTRLGGRWNGRSGECRCPAHDDSSPSLSVRLGDTAILFKCFAGCDTRDVLRALARDDLYDGTRLPMPDRPPGKDLSAAARKIWAESAPIAGTIAERYLEARGLPGPHPRLRFNGRTPLGAGANVRRLPAMIAAVEIEAGPIAVYRTFLDPDDVLRRPFTNPKRMLALPGSGAVRLTSAGDELGLAEGIENALSATAWFGVPTWAVLGAERYASVAIPRQVKRIIIFGDHGPAAEAALGRALPNLEGNGREVVVRLPDHAGDWNDAWRSHLNRDAGDARRRLH